MSWKDNFPEEGRYFETDNGILYCADCLETMEKFNGVTFDAIITDPPYGTTACKWDEIIPLDKMWQELERIISPIGAIVLFGNEPFSSLLRTSKIDLYKYDWYWIKDFPTGYQHAKNMPLKQVENISVFSKGSINHPNLTGKRMAYYPRGVVTGKVKTFKGHPEFIGERPNQLNRKYVSTSNYPSNILKVKRDEQRFHPTQKPVELIKYLVKAYTEENELVLDFTSGSGTTAVACENINRRWICIEKEDKYCEITRKRIEEFPVNLELFKEY